MTLCCVPGAIVNTLVEPLTPNCEGSLGPSVSTTRSLRFSVAAPVLPMVTVSCLLCPMGTAPKSSEEGVTAILGVAGAGLAPLTGMVMEARTGSLLAIVRVPDTFPPVPGIKKAVTVVLPPAAMVKGKDPTAPNDWDPLILVTINPEFP